MHLVSNALPLVLIVRAERLGTSPAAIGVLFACFGADAIAGATKTRTAVMNQRKWSAGHRAHRYAFACQTGVGTSEPVLAGDYAPHEETGGHWSDAPTRSRGLALLEAWVPVEFPADEQAAAFGRFTKPPLRSPLERYFLLDDDLVLVARRRSDTMRLGVAVQLGTVRYLGMFLPDPVDVPTVAPYWWPPEWAASSAAP